MKTREQITDIGISALTAAYTKVKMLGKEGIEPVQNPKHRFADDPSVIFRGDIEAEKAVLSSLREAELPIRVISEEHGETDSTEHPVYLGILDGIDGSKLYKEGKPGYGTMFAIFSGVNPRHDDYLFSGIVDHASGKIFFATKNEGARAFSTESQKAAVPERFETSQKKSFDAGAHVYLHRRAKALFEKLENFQCTNLTCCSLAFTDIVLGKSHLIVELARKDNLEQAIAYGLITEAGGAMVTADGKSIGVKRYLEFIQEKNAVIVTSANKLLAEDFLNKMGVSS